MWRQRLTAIQKARPSGTGATMKGGLSSYSRQAVDKIFHATPEPAHRVIKSRRNAGSATLVHAMSARRHSPETGLELFAGGVGRDGTPCTVAARPVISVPAHVTLSRRG